MALSIKKYDKILSPHHYLLLVFANLSATAYTKQVDRILNDSTEISKQQLFRLVQFRDYLLRSKEDNLYKLRDLLKDWEIKGISDDDQETLILNVGLGKKYSGKTGNPFLKRVNNRLEEEKINVILTQEDIEVIGKMFEVLQLINMGILNLDYLFAIDKDTHFFNELAFYLNEDDTIFEIGAGSGMFGLLVKLLYPDLSLYLNELSYSNYNLIQKLIETHANTISNHNAYAVKGKKILQHWSMNLRIK